MLCFIPNKFEHPMRMLERIRSRLIATKSWGMKRKL